jgi:hypothetical protein
MELEVSQLLDPERQSVAVVDGMMAKIGMICDDCQNNFGLILN